MERIPIGAGIGHRLACTTGDNRSLRWRKYGVHALIGYDRECVLEDLQDAIGMEDLRFVRMMRGRKLAT